MKIHENNWIHWFSYDNSSRLFSHSLDSPHTANVSASTNRRTPQFAILRSHTVHSVNSLRRLTHTHTAPHRSGFTRRTALLYNSQPPLFVQLYRTLTYSQPHIHRTSETSRYRRDTSWYHNNDSRAFTRYVVCTSTSRNTQHFYSLRYLPVSIQWFTRFYTLHSDTRRFTSLTTPRQQHALYTKFTARCSVYTLVHLAIPRDTYNIYWYTKPFRYFPMHTRTFNSQLAKFHTLTR